MRITSSARYWNIELKTINILLALTIHREGELGRLSKKGRVSRVLAFACNPRPCEWEQEDEEFKVSFSDLAALLLGEYTAPRPEQGESKALPLPSTKLLPS